MGGAQARRSVGRPRSIDRDKILAAANRIGVERLTMRAIAAELGVTTQALYNHIGGRRELVLLLANDYDHCFDHDPIALVHWQPWLSAFARALADHLAGQPGLAGSVSTRGPTSSAALRFVDLTIQKMTAEGFEPAAALDAYRAVLELVVCWVQHGEALGDPEAPGRERALFVEALTHADDKELTHLPSIAARWGRSRTELFDYVLAALLAGIATLGPFPPGAPPTPLPRGG